MLLNPSYMTWSVIETDFKKLVQSVPSLLVDKAFLIAKEGEASFLKINYMLFCHKRCIYWTHDLPKFLVIDHSTWTSVLEKT